ncbi:hypothetical protein KI387_001270 [Taxus chinensis]|uniref:Uncharacterized protein n=1 Tax=Taxus chinensis TaxID=29808 RepID=A0AA38GX09_TAXCH|nr:hypothetical protein KI387_001270 [Taxus chinensis]
MTVKQPEVRETVSYLREKEQHRLGMKDNLTYLRVKEQCQFEALQKQQAVAEVAYDQKDASTSLECMIHVNNSMGVPQLSLKEVIECGVLEELVDPNLEIDVKHVVKEMVYKVAKLAFRCLAAEKDDRPNMMEVSAQLQEIKQFRYGGCAEKGLNSYNSFDVVQENRKSLSYVHAGSPTSVQEKWRSTSTTPDNSENGFV